MDDRDPLMIAIDGPAGSGKSSVAALVARRLGLLHLDTGAMYRALTVVALAENIGVDDAVSLAERLRSLELSFRDGVLWIADHAAEEQIRRPEVTASVSEVSAHAAVREAMVHRQRTMSWSSEAGVVVEGRDIGTVVLPLARCKVYLDADLEVRARRRLQQLGGSESDSGVEEIAEDLRRRDRLDSSRTESPLKISPDAHVVDTSALSLDQVVDRCVELARQSLGPEASDEELEPYLFRHRRYRVLHRLFRGVLVGGGFVRVHGNPHERLPTSLIYACNHISWWDPPVVGAAISREVHFLAKRELFRGLLGWFLRLMNCVPIVRGRYDAVAFERCRGILEQGANILIFPEGTRKPIGRPGPMKRGLGILARSSGQPYVPCYVRGTRAVSRALFGSEPMEVWIGPPVRLHALEFLSSRLSDQEIHVRVGELFLEQVRALAHRSESEKKVEEPRG